MNDSKMEARLECLRLAKDHARSQNTLETARQWADVVIGPTSGDGASDGYRKVKVKVVSPDEEG